jgi:hypothetical protein
MNKEKTVSRMPVSVTDARDSQSQNTVADSFLCIRMIYVTWTQNLKLN